MIFLGKKVHQCLPLELNQMETMSNCYTIRAGLGRGKRKITGAGGRIDCKGSKISRLDLTMAFDGARL